MVFHPIATTNAQDSPESSPEKKYLLFDGGHVDSRGEKVYDLETESKDAETPVVGLVTPPLVVKSTKPKFPKSLKKPHASQDVRVEGVAAINGDFIDLKVVGPVAQDVEKCALDTTKTYKLKPATLDGQPVAVKVTIEISFRTR